jgi:hypothetical protein
MGGLGCDLVQPEDSIMALQSQLFRGDGALDACLVSDPAHLTLGTRGPHVVKVQRALVLLDGAQIAGAAQRLDSRSVSARRDDSGLVDSDRMTPRIGWGVRTPPGVFRFSRKLACGV